MAGTLQPGKAVRTAIASNIRNVFEYFDPKSEQKHQNSIDAQQKPIYDLSYVFFSGSKLVFSQPFPSVMQNPWRCPSPVPGGRGLRLVLGLHGVGPDLRPGRGGLHPGHQPPGGGF